MNYRQKRYLNASFLKQIIDEEISLEFLEEKWNEEKPPSKAFEYGTKVHEYLLEGIENDLIKRYSDLKPFIDVIPGKREIELYTALEGVKCKGKIDILGSHSVMDLKTTSGIKKIDNEDELNSLIKGLENDAIYSYKYNLQLAFYELLAGVENSSIIFVTKKAKKNHLFLYRMPKLDNEKTRILDFLALNKDILQQFFIGE